MWLSIFRAESTEDTELGYYSVIRTICESWTWLSDWTELNWITYHNYVFAWHGTVSTQIKSQLQKNCGKQGCSSWAHVLDNVALGKVRIALLQSGHFIVTLWNCSVYTRFTSNISHCSVQRTKICQQDQQCGEGRLSFTAEQGCLS